MTATSDQRAPARLGDVFTDAVDERIDLAIENATPSLLEQALEYIIQQFQGDPFAAVRHRAELYTVDEIAGELGQHRDTISGYTRLPVDHRKHLRRCADYPIRVSGADFADWLDRQRSQ